MRVEFALYAILWLFSLSCPPPLLSSGADYFIAYLAFCSCSHSFLVCVALFRLVGLFSFRSLLFGEARGCFSCRLALGCKVSGRDILHEREMAQPVLLPAIIDIHDLPRFGFVSTSCFLDLMWGKVDLI